MMVEYTAQDSMWTYDECRTNNATIVMDTG